MTLSSSFSRGGTLLNYLKSIDNDDIINTYLPSSSWAEGSLHNSRASFTSYNAYMGRFEEEEEEPEGRVGARGLGLTRAQSRSTASRMSSWCPMRDTPRSSSSWWVMRRSWSPSTFSVSNVWVYCCKQSSRPAGWTTNTNK